jgi:cytochrome c-type biogenesis protein CcmH
MAVFWIIAVVLVVAALALVLPALAGRHAAAPRGTSEDAANITVYRDQLKELETDLAAGTLSREQYDEARREIERRVLEDVGGQERAAVSPAGRKAAAAVGLAVPLLAAAVYFAVGNPSALGTGAGAPDPHGVTVQQIEGLVERLAAKMKENPEDAEGWTMLGRSYSVLDRHPEAAAAYANAVKRAPPSAQLLADYADALAMAQGRELKGEPERLIAQALKVDPKNVKALALAGTVEFQKHDFKAAIAHWRSILDVVPPESEMAQSVRDSIADAEKLAGGKPPASPIVKGATGRVSGTVRLSPALAGKVAPDDTVFIFARAAEGPRMPLAVMRKQVRDLPAAFQLDDSMAMTPAAKISNHPQIVVGARVSKSGSPAPQPGDIEGLSAPAQVGGSGITVVIDTVVR